MDGVESEYRQGLNLPSSVEVMLLTLRVLCVGGGREQRSMPIVRTSGMVKTTSYRW